MRLDTRTGFFVPRERSRKLVRVFGNGLSDLWSGVSREV